MIILEVESGKKKKILIGLGRFINRFITLEMIHFTGDFLVYMMEISKTFRNLMDIGCKPMEIGQVSIGFSWMKASLKLYLLDGY